jgi:hypothetical protein
MNIIETSISDITKSNIDQVKLNLSNQIIENVFPLFDDFNSTKNSEIEELKTSLSTKKNLVQKKKKYLENLIKDFNRKKKIKKLLERIEKLVSSGLVYDSNLKNETIVLLKIIDKIDEDKIDEHLNKTMKTISKRFSK